MKTNNSERDSYGRSFSVAKTNSLLKSLVIMTAIGLAPSISIAANTSNNNSANGSNNNKTNGITGVVGTTFNDQAIEHKVNQVLAAQIPDGSFTVASYKQKVLLAGQVPSAADKTKAGSAVKDTAGVKKVWNYLTVGSNESAKDIADDAYITSAVKTKLLTQKGINSNNIKVVTSNKVVYLMGHKAGKMSQVNKAILDLKEIDNVSDVVNLIER